MKVAIDARLFGTAHRGIGRYVAELTRAMLQADPALELVLLTSQTQGDLNAWGRRVKFVRARSRVYGLAEQWEIPKLLWGLKPDLVHIPHFNVPLLPLPAPLVMTVHDLLVHEFPDERATTQPRFIYRTKLLAYRFTVWQGLRRAAAVITVSRSAKNSIAKWYPWASDKIRAIPLAPARLPAGQAGPGVRKPYVLMVGAAYPHKNLERALEAVGELRKWVPDCTMAVAGKRDYFMDRFLRLAEQGGRRGFLRFLGQVDDAALADLYKGAAAYFLPSLGEGFGLGAVEALLHGCPVVAADIPVLREVLGDAAVFADPYDLPALCAALRAVVTDGAIRNTLLANAAPVLARYSWERTAAETLRAYKEAIARA